MLQCTAAKPTKGNHTLGYTLCMAIACENGCRRIVPPMLRLWSSAHPEYASENDEVCQVVGQIASATNMAALVVAVSYFAAAWLCRKVKLEALANHVAKVSRKMYEAPEFFYYAIADGLRWLFVCHGR